MQYSNRPTTSIRKPALHTLAARYRNKILITLQRIRKSRTSKPDLNTSGLRIPGTNTKQRMRTHYNRMPPRIITGFTLRAFVLSAVFRNNFLEPLRLTFFLFIFVTLLQCINMIFQQFYKMRNTFIITIMKTIQHIKNTVTHRNTQRNHKRIFHFVKPLQRSYAEAALRLPIRRSKSAILIVFSKSLPKLLKL